MFDEVKQGSWNSYNAGRWVVFRDVTEAYYKDSRYQRTDNGLIKKDDGPVMTLDEAIDDFIEMLMYRESEG